MHHLHSRLRANLTPPLKEGEKKGFYTGLDVVSQRIDELTAKAMGEAKAELAKEQKAAEEQRAAEEKKAAEAKPAE